MKEIVKDYGNYIRERRLEKGLSQEEIAKKLGISQTTYGRYELGKREPGLDFVLAIAKILDFNPGDFFNDRRF